MVLGLIMLNNNIKNFACVICASYWVARLFERPSYVITESNRHQNQYPQIVTKIIKKTLSNNKNKISELTRSAENVRNFPSIQKKRCLPVPKTRMLTPSSSDNTVHTWRARTVGPATAHNSNNCDDCKTRCMTLKSTKWAKHSCLRTVMASAVAGMGCKHRR